MTKTIHWTRLLTLIGLSILVLLPRTSLAAIESETGGQIKAAAGIVDHENNTVQDMAEDDPWLDSSILFRLKNRTFLNDTVSFSIHYLASSAWGDTIRTVSRINKLLEGTPFSTRFQSPGLDDRTSLMDLTSTLSDQNAQQLSHGLDRLLVEYSPEWGTIILGRQAVTWGNGMLFNPMDLFNPFSPSDIERDYKKGDDMVYFRTGAGALGELQILYVPRRNYETLDVDWDNSSLGGKLHLFTQTVEFDFMAAYHRSDSVIGVGSTGSLKGAAWRMDAVYTQSGGTKDEDFLSVTANMDYSWIWMGKNFYGFLEYFYSGVGSDDYTRIFTDPDIYERMAAGDIFTMGKHYVSGHINLELHPLVNACLTVINNVQDPSGLVQPRIIWNITNAMDITIGGGLCYGGTNTEFGRIQIPDTTLYTSPGNSFYVWMTWYF